MSWKKGADRLAILTKGIKILRFVGSHRFGVTINQIVKEVGIGRRDTYRYLAALQKAGIRIHKFRSHRGGNENVWRMTTTKEHMEKVGIL